MIGGESERLQSLSEALCCKSFLEIFYGSFSTWITTCFLWTSSEWHLADLFWLSCSGIFAVSLSRKARSNDKSAILMLRNTDMSHWSDDFQIVHQGSLSSVVGRWAVNRCVLSFIHAASQNTMRLMFHSRFILCQKCTSPHCCVGPMCINADLCESEVKLLIHPSDFASKVETRSR